MRTDERHDFFHSICAPVRLPIFMSTFLFCQTLHMLYCRSILVSLRSIVIFFDIYILHCTFCFLFFHFFLLLLLLFPVTIFKQLYCTVLTVKLLYLSLNGNMLKGINSIEFYLIFFFGFLKSINFQIPFIFIKCGPQYIFLYFFQF